MTAVPCFGGPWNGRTIEVERRRSRIEVPIPPKTIGISASELEADPLELAEVRRGTYVLERFGVLWRGDRLVYEIFVFEGYPVDRITFEANVVLALCSWPWPFGPVRSLHPY